MKTILVGLAVLSAGTFRICDSEEEAEAPPSAESAPTTVAIEAELPTIEATAAVAQPQHGGTVVVVQDHAVEVVAQPSGEIAAYVVNIEGHAPPPPSTVVMVNIHANDGVARPVALTWNAELGFYAGRLEAVTPAPGPVEVTLVVEGRRRWGRVATYAVYVEPPVAEVQVVAPAGRVDVRTPPPRAGIEVNAQINVPSVRVNVGGPSVRVRTGQRVRSGRRVDVRRNRGKAKGHRIGMGHRRSRGMGHSNHQH